MFEQCAASTWTLHAELRCGACSLGLCAEIIQSWGINAHREKNRRTQVPRAHTCGHSSPYKNPHCDACTKFKRNTHGQIYYDIKSTYLSFWCFLFFLLLRRTIKETRLHVVNVSDRTEENNLEPEWAGSVNINFVPAADSSGLARPDQRKKKNYPKLLSSIARSSPSEIQEWRKSFWIASSRRIDVAQLSFFFDRIKIPRWTWGVRYPPSALWLFACFPLSLPC